VIKNIIFYTLKPFIPRRLQIFIRRQVALYKRKKYSHIWPIDPKAGNVPEGWPGWPDGKKFALVLTHDVETQKGYARVKNLMDLEETIGFRSSFNFVAEKYNVSELLRRELLKRGFEAGIHGLRHDGKLYLSEKVFNERATRINQYLHDWKAVGFRSPAMHHNLAWLHKLQIVYDASTFDTDPFEPQSDGVRTIFPFWVNGNSFQNGYLELPYTLPQDFTLFVLLKEKNIKLWKRKLDWLADKGGMALLNTHPDYMSFDGEKLNIEEYPVELYKEFLYYLTEKFKGKYWHALPNEVTQFWSSKLPIKRGYP
jgi:peptidoglycan/xylan/chitin deacetylase (PgdA/CDA1 family)